MQGRYADGRAAVFTDANVETGPDALTVHVGDVTHVWTYKELRRADDGNGCILLKRKPDTGERLMLDRSDELTLKLAAPSLCTPRAQGVEGRTTVGVVIAGAWAVAAAFFIGIPMAAEPISTALPTQYREQVSDISWSQVNAMTTYCDDSDEAARILNDVAYRLMATSNVPKRDDIWITIVDAPFPNAFALPDDSIIITDDLIAMAQEPDEVVGVLAHEIAHIEHNHIMKNVIRQMGAGIFFDIVFGGAGAGQAIAIASVNLAGLRFTRDDEADADARGIDYLEAAHLDPGRLAAFFDLMEAVAEEEGAGNIPTMLSTHPATPARAAAARARSHAGLAPSLSDTDWRIVRQACGGSAEASPNTPAPQTRPAPAPPAPPAGPSVPDKPQ